MIRPHAERGRWWSTATTRYSPITLDGETELRCDTCGGDAYGRYGDGYRCHDCGRPVENVDDDGLLPEDERCATPRSCVDARANDHKPDH